MAETIIFIIVEGVLKKIGSFLLSQISLAWDAKKELKKLKMTSSTIKAVLLDAEEQPVKNHAMKDWLEKLKDAAYDVESILSEFSTESRRRKVKIHCRRRRSMLKVQQQQQQQLKSGFMNGH